METNWNQLIERYLNNELSAEGKAAFESELTKNTELQKEFELHKLTQELIRRNSLRTLVQESSKWFHLKKVLLKSGIALVIAGILAASIYLFAPWKNESAERNAPEQIEQSMLKKLEEDLAFENIDPEYFQFTGKSDVFLSESGVLLSLTEESFLLDGEAYKGEAIVQWQEAQTAAEIVRAGLSTKSGDELLETQGMFSLNAFTPEGKKLQLTDKGVYVQVPVDELKKDMKLFTGVPQKNGTIDWQTPVELERLPKPKDMSKMDLFPPRYEPKLNELKWFKEKAKRDSLYLSFEEENSASDSTGIIVDAEEEIMLYSKPEMKTPKRISENPNSDGAASISMMVFGKPQDIGNQTGISKIKSQKSGPQNAKDKAQWTFHVQYLENHEAMVIANVTIAKNWHINALNAPKESFGLPTNFKLKEAPDFTLLGSPSETKPIMQHDDIVDEDLAYHEGRAQFRQKIKINSKKEFTLNVSYLFTACNENGCLPPFAGRMTIIVHPNNEKQIKSHIPPSKVLAVWNKKFNNTNLATQDFEDRMKEIHETCNEKVFDVYAKNLDKPLWELDQRVVKMGYPQFQRFADQKVGMIRIDEVHQQNLAAFYEEAIEKLRKKGKKEVEAALAKEEQWDSEVQDGRQKEVLRKGIRATLNAKEEADFNRAHVAKQLNQTVGFSITAQTVASGDKSISGNSSRVYKAQLPVVVNIDRLTRNLLSSRKSVEVFTLDKEKKAAIRYSDFTANVERFKDFDRLYFYLFPKQVNSYERRDFVNGKLNHALNGAMDYSGLAFGLNEDGFYIFEIPALQAKDFGSIKLEKVSEKQFEARLKQLNDRRGVSATPIHDELNWLFREKANYQVLRKRRENVQFRNTVRPTIYSCLGNDAGAVDTIQIPQKASFLKNFNREQDPMAISDVPANFPGGMTVLRAFINENIQIPREMIEKNITGKLVLTLIVDENGKVEQVIPKKEIPGCPECTAEGIRVAKKIPNFTPGEVNGKKVKTYFALPISFKSN